MQSDHQHLHSNTKLPLADQVGRGYIPNSHIASFFSQNADFPPSKVCPRNFIIFDRTDNHSQIMYHQAVSLGIGVPGTSYIDNNMLVRSNVNAPRELNSFIKEDSADIDLLLNFEEEDSEEEYEEEELSTARTQKNDLNDTADSCSSKLVKSRLALSSFSHKSSGSSARKREKMRKMVHSLRGIVPGGNQMNSVAVIDEAIKYLKSLKVELQKVGVGNLKN
ncbi:transcription factor bHLH144 [Tanacetum coccineum]